jgi:lipopolysaccharide export LptBFGC system permease protein LptF
MYIFSEAFQLYVIGFSGFMAFLIINQLFLEGDRLLNPNFPTKEILKLIGLSVPYFFTLAIPIAVLFSTLMSMGRLAKDNEIDALFTNGIHLYRLFLPFLVLSLMNVVIVFVVNEGLVPKANAASEAIYQKYPYLRDVQEEEADPIIVKLPSGAFFASTYVDKNTGSSFYAVFDTLTMQQAQDVETPEAFGPPPLAAPPPESGVQPPPTESPLDQPATPPPPGMEPRGPAPSKDVGPRPKPEPRPRPPAAKPGVAEAAEVAPEAPPTADGKLSVTAEGVEPTEPDRRLYLAANARIIEQTLSAAQPFVYFVGKEGLIDRREQRSNASLELGLPLKDVFTDIKTPEELSREELQRQTEVKRQIGVSPAKDATDFYLKFSIPFACLFLSLVAMPLSLRAPRDERLLGLVVTFVLVMSYYVIYFVAKLMGYNEMLPPFFAAWMQNIIFAGIAMFVFAISRK